MAAERAFNRRPPADPVNGEDEAMGRPRKDRWTRWGRGSCEGYGLELGSLLRFGVTRYRAGLDGPESWGVSLNGKSLGSFETFEAATAHAEREARLLLEPAWEDWQIALAKPPARRRALRFRKAISSASPITASAMRSQPDRARSCAR